MVLHGDERRQAVRKGVICGVAPVSAALARSARAARGTPDVLCMAWTGAGRRSAGGSTGADGVVVRTLVRPTGAHGEVAHPARFNDVVQGVHLRAWISVRLRWRAQTGLPSLRSACLRRNGGLRAPERVYSRIPRRTRFAAHSVERRCSRPGAALGTP